MSSLLKRLNTLLATPTGNALVTTSKLALAVNVTGFVATFLTESHKVTDLAGCSSFGIASLLTLWKSKNYQPTQLLLTSSVCLWSLRLASFLFYRVLTLGKDDRLHIFFPNRGKGETWLYSPKHQYSKPKLLSLLGFWTMQTMWCIIVLSPVFMAQFCGTNRANPISNQPKNESTQPKPILQKVLRQMRSVKVLSWIGFASFALFLGMETVADFQKFSFKQIATNKDSFMKNGLFRYSQFPNYFAEISIWCSIFVAALPVLPKKHLWTAISPIFTYLLLRYVSGIPFLLKGWEKKYGHLPEFRQWRDNTNELFPGFPASN